MSPGTAGQPRRVRLGGGETLIGLGPRGLSKLGPGCCGRDTRGVRVEPHGLFARASGFQARGEEDGGSLGIVGCVGLWRYRTVRSTSVDA